MIEDLDQGFDSSFAEAMIDQQQNYCLLCDADGQKNVDL